MNIPTVTKTRIGGKKSKRRNKGPARLRYWLKRTLEARKIRHLMKYCGMSKQTAYNSWHQSRRGRVPEGYLLRKDPI